MNTRTENIKTIRVKMSTYNRLVKKAKYGDSMDDAINRILDSKNPSESETVIETQETEIINVPKKKSK